MTESRMRMATLLASLLTLVLVASIVLQTNQADASGDLQTIENQLSDLNTTVSGLSDDLASLSDSVSSLTDDVQALSVATPEATPAAVDLGGIESQLSDLSKKVSAVCAAIADIDTSTPGGLAPAPGPARC